MTPEQKRMLNDKLPASAVRERDGGNGRPLSYVDGFYVFDRLNEVLGIDGWSYTYDELRVVQDDDQYSTKAGVRHKAAYTVKVTLSAYGSETDRNLHVSDVGYGDGIDKDKGKAHESAAKESVTDGVKRCARKLGRSLGLALYDKSQKHVAEEKLTDEQERFLAHCEEMGFTLKPEEYKAAGATLISEGKAMGLTEDDVRTAFMAGMGRER